MPLVIAGVGSIPIRSHFLGQPEADPTCGVLSSIIKQYIWKLFNSLIAGA